MQGVVSKAAEYPIAIAACGWAGPGARWSASPHRSPKRTAGCQRPHTDRAAGCSVASPPASCGKWSKITCLCLIEQLLDLIEKVINLRWMIQLPVACELLYFD